MATLLVDAAKRLLGSLCFGICLCIVLLANMSRNESRIYVGNLPPDIRTKDIEDLFYKFGKIVFIDLKDRVGPPFAFVEFEDPR